MLGAQLTYVHSDINSLQRNYSFFLQDYIVSGFGNDATFLLSQRETV